MIYIVIACWLFMGGFLYERERAGKESNIFLLVLLANAPVLFPFDLGKCIAQKLSN